MQGGDAAGDRRLTVFSGRANPDLAARVAGHLGVELGQITLKTFSAGETYCRYDESVRGAHVFIVQPICGNEATGINTNDALVEMLLMVDAAKGASAHQVCAVMPWFGYSRQDKRSARREPISARTVAHVLEAVGVDRVMSMDLHADQVQGFFRRPLDHLTALYTLADYFRDRVDDVVVVSPDVGRVKLNHKFAERIGADLALMTKQRPEHQVAEIGYVLGDVKGKCAVIVDDIIDTAGTLKAAALTVREAGAKRVYATATHALMSGNAFENLAEAGFEEIVVTDSVPVRAGAPDNVVVLSCAPLIADTIGRVVAETSVSEALEDGMY